jgi:hypothetical protein
MAVGEYVVYERASKDEEQLFLKIAIEVVGIVKEPSNWMKPRNPKKHAGGRKPISYHFKPTMMLVLLLMNYHGKDYYREMEAHLKCNKHLLTELGLKESPSKSTIHVAYGKVGTKLLRKLNDTALSKFKREDVGRRGEESKETHICRLIRTENKQKE